MLLMLLVMVVGKTISMVNCALNVFDRGSDGEAAVA